MNTIHVTIRDLENQKKSIEAALRTLRGLEGSGGRGARNISAAGRARIAEAQRRRWSKFRSETQQKKK